MKRLVCLSALTLCLISLNVKAEKAFMTDDEMKGGVDINLRTNVHNTTIHLH